MVESAFYKTTLEYLNLLPRHYRRDFHMFQHILIETETYSPNSPILILPSQDKRKPFTPDLIPL